MEGMKISFISDSDIYKWQILITGPKESPYAVRHVIGY